MAFYENVFIARQDISGAQVEALADSLAQIVAEHGGEVKKREYWGLKNLAYRIRKNRKGHYVLFNLDAPPSAIAELERTMGINEDVIRYLTIRVEALEEGPSAMMQRERGREERSRRGAPERGPERGSERAPERTPERTPEPREPASREASPQSEPVEA